MLKMRRYEDTAPQILKVNYDCPLPTTAIEELEGRKTHFYREFTGEDIRSFYQYYSKRKETVLIKDEPEDLPTYEQKEQIELQKITEAIFEAVFSKHDPVLLKQILKGQETERFTVLTDSLINALLNLDLPESNLEINEYVLSTDTNRDKLLFGRCGDGIDIARAYLAYLGVGFDPTDILSRNEIFTRLSILSNLKRILDQIPTDTEDALLFRNSVHYNFEYIVQTIELILGSLELNGWDKSAKLEDQFKYVGLTEIRGFYSFSFGLNSFKHFFSKLNNYPNAEIKFKYCSRTRIVRKKAAQDEHIIFPLGSFNPKAVDSKGTILKDFLNRLNVASCIFNGRKIENGEDQNLPYTNLSNRRIYEILGKTQTVSLNTDLQLVNMLDNQINLGIEDIHCAKGVLKYIEYLIMCQNEEVSYQGGFLLEAAMHHEA